MLAKKVDKRLEFKKHIYPSLRLFIPTVAVSVYVIFDKTLIKVITGLNSEVGYYEQAEKIAKIGLTVLTALGTVMVPKNTNSLANKDFESVRRNIYRSFNYVFLLGVPLTFGLIAAASNFVPWFLGADFEKSAILLMLLSGVIIPIGMSNVVGIQYLIPAGKDNKYTVSVVAGAVINFGLNFLFIYFFKSVGAAIATIIAETCVTVIQLLFVAKEFSMRRILLGLLKYVCVGAVMFIAVYLTARYLKPGILNTCLLIAEGAVIYLASLLIIRDKTLFEGLRTFIKRRKV
jgi:O-antigen/teichoic acid export membrane protein